jgi:hypothetical protein
MKDSHLLTASQSELTENDAMRFDDQFPAIDEGAIEVEDNELH